MSHWDGKFGKGKNGREVAHPAVLATAKSGFANLVVVTGTTVLGHGGGSQREDRKREGAHYNNFVRNIFHG